ncbi:type I-E CRISPR-associated protein Cse2/CasB [Halomonas aquamarina]|uniref:Type I-E CRISPR-associated protein Cse2/CasB n=1 Tax=Vreelandella aquamarina TaxID=77097 RepID=A0ACC5VXS4_9GAMM|nr:type I-E CRISPR-associated protein Cse2/CasB [Halomonas aquamarina]MBZ5488457.1 type I-E CRISPR-associated protein Cse2/CasB [Halomonas aquamarina]
MSETEQQTPPEANNPAITGDKAKEYRHALTSDEAYTLRLWWQRLTLDPPALKKITEAPAYPRGVRAVLRRCDTVESVMLTEAFRHLWSALESQVWEKAPTANSKKQRDQRLETWAIIAAVASELRDEASGAPLGKRLGEKRPNTTDTPRMSDLRFQQLLDCHTPEELIRRFRRALKLAGNEAVSVVLLADMVALWAREQRGQYRAEATQRFAFVMSDAYFHARALKPAAGD